MATSNDEREIFNKLTSKLSYLFIEQTERDWRSISDALTELTLLNYRYSVVENPTKAVLLINQCCYFIPADQEILIRKCCALISSLTNHQKVIVEGRTLTIAIQWCLRILSIRLQIECPPPENESIIQHLLQALDSLLRNSSHNAQSYIFDILTPTGPILKLLETSRILETVRCTLQCLESCTILKEENDETEQEKYKPYLEKCATIFMDYLLHPKSLTDISVLKINVVCLRGLENIVLQNDEFVLKELGLLLGIIKSYMLLGIEKCDFVEPKCLLPTLLSIPEPPANGIREKKGGKITKLRKHRIQKKEETRKSVMEEWMNSKRVLNKAPGSKCLVLPEDISKLAMLSLPQILTSDSDFSDGDMGLGENHFKLQARVRQMSLSLFFTVAKNTPKNTMFSFWSNFIPENSLSGKHYLPTCILEDPSPKGRTAALNVLLYLLTSSKQYLSMAESSNQSTSFTPYSVILGYMIIELHHYLSLALNEKVAPVLAQVLKCYAALVQASPYHRLNPGLVTKVVRGMRNFIQYKDPTIKVGALIVLGCILASEPVAPETKDLFLKSKNKETNECNEEEDKKTTNDEDFGYAEFSSDDEEDIESEQKYKALPWILERCLTNLGVVVADTNISPHAPAPVKLESVQVISSMCRNYFECLIYPYLIQIGKALDDCLSIDKYADLKLHTGRTIDFIGQSMEQYLSSLDVCSDEKVAPGLIFWQTLINGSLTSLLQSEQQAAMKAVGCDCLGSIGSHVFERLPGDKQILCVTLLFACSRDEENSVRGAALRALGISVLYPILREDPGFVVDTAEAVYTSLQDENLVVRIKSSWSLGNLSDALVLNSTNEDLEELPHSLLLKLLERCITSCSDTDKIKMNIVRTIGNLLQLMTPDLMLKMKFKEVVESAVNCLIKTATTGSNMKVRWNSCYAIGNVLKNGALYIDNSKWLGQLFEALNGLVINFRNFKVRINAALALSSPFKRRHYGIYYQTTWISLLKALENSQNIDDFSEYQHRDNLVEQICLALGHLISIVEVDDLCLIYDSLSLYFDMLESQIKRVNEMLIPEKSDMLFAASAHLKTFSSNNMNTEASAALIMLKDIFVQEY